MVFFSPKSEEAEDSDIQTMATVFWQDDGCELMWTDTSKLHLGPLGGLKGVPWASKLKLIETKPLDFAAFAIIWTHSGVIDAGH